MRAADVVRRRRGMLRHPFGLLAVITQLGRGSAQPAQKCLQPCKELIDGEEAVPGTACKYFYVCRGGRPTNKLACGQGRVFDEEIMACNDESLVEECSEYLRLCVSAIPSTLTRIIETIQLTKPAPLPSCRRGPQQRDRAESLRSARQVSSTSERLRLFCLGSSTHPPGPSVTVIHSNLLSHEIAHHICQNGIRYPGKAPGQYRIANTCLVHAKWSGVSIHSLHLRHADGCFKNNGSSRLL